MREAGKDKVSFQVLSKRLTRITGYHFLRADKYEMPYPCTGARWLRFEDHIALMRQTGDAGNRIIAHVRPHTALRDVVLLPSAREPGQQCGTPDGLPEKVKHRNKPKRREETNGGEKSVNDNGFSELKLGSKTLVVPTMDW